MIAHKPQPLLRAAGALMFLSLLPFVGSGCSKGKGDVTGKVTHKGQPVVTGTVTLIGTDGLPHHGAIEADGSYIVLGVPTGPAKVGVHSPNPTPGLGDSMTIQRSPTISKETAKSATGKPKAPPGDAGKKWFPLPEQTSDPDRSGITLDVKRGQNAFDIALERASGGG